MRKPGTAAGVLLILMFVCRLHAAAVVLDASEFMRSTKTRILAIEIIEKVQFYAIPPEFEFLLPFNASLLATLRFNKLAGENLPGSAFFKYQADSGTYATNFPGARADGPDLGQSRLEMSDEPIPTAAVLVLIGLIAFIALNRRRK